ncbi:putative Protocadherin Fat 4 [Hypsibius exemplaris]|uniref:Protocadherin Fat 4 n=1 Tax=Hypsibius exemplaris TaxID=2072580 RepID=A0A1W0WHL9_HYPEX|nr:putative Protocadherin Fat 4 [Hypsibius exemplaris]
MKRLRLHRILFLCWVLKIILPDATAATMAVTSSRTTADSDRATSKRPPARHPLKPAFITQPLPMYALRWNLTLENSPLPPKYSDAPRSLRSTTITPKPTPTSTTLRPDTTSTTPRTIQKNFPGVMYLPDTTSPPSPSPTFPSASPTHVTTIQTPRPTTIQTNKASTVTNASKRKYSILQSTRTTLRRRTVFNTTIRATAINADLIIRPNFMSKGQSSVTSVESSPSDHSAAAAFPPPSLVNDPSLVASFSGNFGGTSGGTDHRIFFAPPAPAPPAPAAESPGLSFAGPYFALVRENAAIGTHVITVEAGAIPSTGGSSVIYEILRGNERGQFRIDADGHITVQAPLDREIVDGYNLTIRAFDYTGQESLAPVLIRVVDVNDHAPVITASHRFIAPCGVANAAIGRVHATDQDTGRNGQVYFCLDQDHSTMGLFYIDPLTGELATLTELPPQPERYQLQVTAKDQGLEGQMTAQVQVTVFVQCSSSSGREVEARVMIPNHNGIPVPPPPPPLVRAPPVCQQGPAGAELMVTLAMGASIGENVATVAAASADGEPLMFTFLPGREATFFHIHPSSGQIRVSAPLAEATYRLGWQARDSFGMFCNGFLVVQLIPFNVPPTFSAPTYQFIVTQCGQPGVSLGTVDAVDPNVGILGQISYSSPDENFVVDSRTGSITIKHPVQDTPRPYIFPVMATDGGGVTAVVNVTMIVQCRFAEAPAPPDRSLPQPPPPSPPLEERLLLPQPERPPERLQPRLPEPQLPLLPQPERPPDRNQPRLPEPPLPLHPALERQQLPPPATIQFEHQAYAFPMQCGIPNAEIGRVSAMNSRGEPVNYSILPNPANLIIQPATGIISTTSPLSPTPPSHPITVVASTFGMDRLITAQVPVTVNVVCRQPAPFNPHPHPPPVRSHQLPPPPLPMFPPPVCSSEPLVLNLPDPLPVGEVIATVQAAPRPVGAPPLRYILPDLVLSFLQINSKTGDIRLIQRFEGSFITNGGGSLLVRATDDASGAFCPIPVQINVNPPVSINTPPVFPNSTYSFEVVGCFGRLDVVGHVLARDMDGGVNGVLRYSLDGPDSAFFQIDQFGNIRPTGELSRQMYSLIAVARDGAGATAQALVRISLMCRAPVQCPSDAVSFNVHEATPTGTQVGLIRGVSGSGVTYQLMTTGADTVFSVNQVTGEISTKLPMRALQSVPAPSPSRTANFVVRATDERQNHCDISVFIMVNFTMNFPPVFDNSSYVFQIGCLRPGILIGLVRARDSTEDISARLIYDLTGTDAKLFAISTVTGEIHFKGVPLVRSSFHFAVGATDPGGLRAEAAVAVMADCPPLKCPSSVALQIPEDLPAGHVVGQIPPVENAHVAGGVIGYRLVLASSIMSVVVNPLSGAMTLAQPISPAAAVAPPGLLGFIVGAFDQTGQTCNVSVKVGINRRLRPPEFVGTPYVFTGKCSQLNNVIGRVTAVFAGSFQPASVAYSISHGDKRAFAIDEVSGEIRLVGNLTQTRMPLQVTAHDINGLTANAFVEVILPPCPLDCPAIVRAQVRDDAPRGVGVTFVSTSTSLANGVVYQFHDAIVTSEIAGLFLIDPLSGAVTLNGNVEGRGGQVFRVPIVARAASGQACEIMLEVGVVRRSIPSLFCPRLVGAEVRQDAEVGSVLTKVNVGEPGDFIFSLTEMSGAGGFFEIERDSGILRVSSRLYSLPPRTYNLAVRASMRLDVTKFCDTEVAVIVHLFNTSLQCTSMPVVATVDQSSTAHDAVAIIRVGSPNGNPLTFTLAEPSPPIISVNRTNGVVSLSGGFFNATLPQYQFVIRAADFYGAFCDTTLLLNIPPVNRPPVFLSGHYQFTTTCGPQNSFIGVVSANDRDNDRLSFDLTPAEFFTIDQLGTIRTRVPIMAVIPRQSLIAMVSDPAGGHSTAQVTVIFNGLGCGSPPVCTQPVYRYDLPAVATVGTVVGTVTAFDPDGDRLSYVIAGATDQHTFGVDPTTGTIQLLQSLGQSSQTAYQFSVRASSAANAFCEMTIQINLRSPEGRRFLRPSYAFEVPCASGSSTSCLGRVSVSNGVGNIRFSTAPDSMVTVDETTGEVCLRVGRSNAGTEISQTAVISGTDLISGSVTTTTVTISYQACKRPPICSPTSLTSAVNEVDPIGTRVQQLTVKDPDPGEHLTYSIASGNADKLFSINPDDGIVVVNGPLDRERDNNDNAPIFTRAPYAFAVPCQRSLAFVGVVTALDADVGMNARVTYSANPSAPISVDSETGEIRTKASALEGLPNGPLVIDVFASDSGSPQRTASTPVTILVNCTTPPPPPAARSGPLCPPPSNVHIRENSQPNTILTQVTDPQGQPLRYFLNGIGADRFQITPSGHVIVVGLIDRETSQNPFTLSIHMQNAEGQTCSTMMTVTILDENDQSPSFVGEDSFVVDCGLSNVRVGVVSARDGDDGENADLDYSILGASTDFGIDRKSGEIRTLRPLDGQVPVRELTVTVSDNGTPRRTSQAVVRVTVRPNCSPSISHQMAPNSPLPLKQLRQCQAQYTLRVRGDTAIGTELTTINQGFGGSGFSIVGGNEAGSFRLDPQTGQLTLTKPLLPGTTELAVTDQFAVQPCISRVLITVVDENNNTPTFEHPSYLFTTPCGSKGVIGRVSAVDPDQGLNGVLTLSITGTSAFTIDSRSGEVHTTFPLPAIPSAYQFTVTATDGGQPRRSASSVVTINVRPCLSMPDQISSPTTTMGTYAYSAPRCPEALVMEVEENRAGIVLGSVMGRDANPGGVLRYMLLPTADSRHFQVDTVANAGRLTVVTPLDRESEGTIIVDVRVLNNYGQFCETPVRINVLDVNDNPPVFPQNQYQFRIDCTGQPPFTIGTVEALDADLGVNGVVIYSAPTDQPFTVNPSTGSIVLPNYLAAVSSGRQILTTQIAASNPTPPRHNALVTIQVLLAPSCFIAPPQQPPPSARYQMGSLLAAPPAG